MARATDDRGRGRDPAAALRSSAAGTSAGRGPLPIVVLATLRETNASERPGLAPSTLAQTLGLHADTLELGRLDLEAATAVVERVEEAQREYEALWPGLERSLLLMVHLTRTEAWFMRGNIAIAALAVDRAGGRATTRASDRMAARAIKLLGAEKSAFARGLGAALTATRARLDEDVAGALTAFDRAESELGSAGMAAHVAAIRWSRAHMRSDDPPA